MSDKKNEGSYINLPTRLVAGRERHYGFKFHLYVSTSYTCMRCLAGVFQNKGKPRQRICHQHSVEAFRHFFVSKVWIFFLTFFFLALCVVCLFWLCMFNLNPKNHIYILTDDNWVKKFRESRSSIGRTAKGKNNNKKKETTRTHDWEISSDSIASFYVNSCPSGYNEHPRLFL